MRAESLEPELCQSDAFCHQMEGGFFHVFLGGIKLTHSAAWVSWGYDFFPIPPFISYVPADLLPKGVVD